MEIYENHTRDYGTAGCPSEGTEHTLRKAGGSAGAASEGSLKSFPWLRYGLLAVMTIVIGSSLAFSVYKSDRMTRVYLPLAEAAAEIKYRVTAAHLWFEEILGGDSSDTIEEVWDNIDKAVWHAMAMLQGGENREWRFVPLEDEGLRLKVETMIGDLTKLKEIMKERLWAFETSFAGSTSDKRFDSLFRQIINETDMLERNLHTLANGGMASFQRIQVVLILSGTVLLAMVWVIFMRFDRRRSAYLLKVRESKEDLESEMEERHRIEKILRLNEDRMRMLFELRQMNNASEGELTSFALEEVVRLTNSKVGYFHFFNEDQKTLRLYMWSKGALEQCTAEKVPHYPLDRAGVWADCVRTGIPVVHNDFQSLPGRKGYPEGHFHVVRHMSMPVFDNGKIIAVAGVGNKEEDYDEADLLQLRLFMDSMWRIIKHNQDEKELEKSHRELERSNRELEQFAYVASHDLQEPLRMISSYVQLLARRYGGKLDSDADEFINYAVDGAKRMQKLINDLLTYSRAGASTEEKTEINLNSIFSKVTENLNIAIKESEATVSSDYLPRIVADETHMIQLMQNLIGNALKFRSDRTPEVHVSAQEHRDGWTFSVSDNGIGLDPQYSDRIFQIFQRLHGNDRYPGTGIGLSVCKKIVEKSGGQIWFESEPGQGSTFYFTIPQEVRDDENQDEEQDCRHPSC